MAEDRIAGREPSWRSLVPWTELFRGFHLALDLGKLLLAAAGILTMALGWWLLSVIFGAGYGLQPTWDEFHKSTENKESEERAWEDFKRERSEWNLMHEAAGAGRVSEDAPPLRYELADISATLDEYKTLRDAKVQTYDEYIRWAQDLRAKGDPRWKEAVAREPLYAKLGKDKPSAGTISTSPWTEDRGPNPFLLTTGQAGVPWEAGHFWDWFSRKQFPVMVEPLVKLVRPIIYFFDPRAGGFAKFYFFLVMIWTVITWAIFGGAITRIAAVQAARGEKIGMSEALRFTIKRLSSFVMAPLFPVCLLIGLILLTIIFGYFVMIPFVGDFIAGFMWVGMLVLGLIMAVVLVGLVGWPLMSATISAEGTDSWEAVSRSYSYVYQKPWYYIWNSLVAICYGAILVFFVGFMGSLTAYLSKWGVAHTPGIEKANREPSFLFVYTPQSFGWRALLMQGAKVDGAEVVQDGRIDPALYDKYLRDFHWWNHVAAGLMAIWLGLLFMLILGFGYSYFWTAGTLIYLLMRRSVDAAELDEVYLEDEEPEGPYAPAPAPAPGATTPSPTKPGTAPLTMIEPPALRPAPAPVSTPASTVPESTAPPQPIAGDGEPQPPSTSLGGGEPRQE